MNISRTRYIATIAIFSAISFGLMYLEFSIPSIMPTFVKLDFSELPALIGSFALGPISGVIICLIKNLIHVCVTSTLGVGELCNFLLGAIFVFSAGLIYKYKKTRKWALISMIIGSLIMAILSFPINLFITYPFYYTVMKKEVILAMYQAIIPSITSIELSLLVFNVPFNFVKCLLVSIITFIVYKPLSYLIKQYHFTKKNKEELLDKNNNKENID